MTLFLVTYNTILHCLERISSQKMKLLTVIKEGNIWNYKIVSYDTQSQCCLWQARLNVIMYTLKLEKVEPTCTMQTFFAIILHKAAWQWDNLPLMNCQSPYLPIQWWWSPEELSSLYSSSWLLEWEECIYFLDGNDNAYDDEQKRVKASPSQSMWHVYVYLYLKIWLPLYIYMYRPKNGFHVSTCIQYTCKQGLLVWRKQVRRSKLHSKTWKHCHTSVQI